MIMLLFFVHLREEHLAAIRSFGVSIEAMKDTMSTPVDRLLTDNNDLEVSGLYTLYAKARQQGADMGGELQLG